jgi:hypothetical protein
MVGAAITITTPRVRSKEKYIFFIFFDLFLENLIIGLLSLL